MPEAAVFAAVPFALVLPAAGRFAGSLPAAEPFPLAPALVLPPAEDLVPVLAEALLDDEPAFEAVPALAGADLAAPVLEAVPAEVEVVLEAEPLEAAVLEAAVPEAGAVAESASAPTTGRLRNRKYCCPSVHTFVVTQ